MGVYKATHGKTSTYGTTLKEAVDKLTTKMQPPQVGALEEQMTHELQQQAQPQEKK